MKKLIRVLGVVAGVAAIVWLTRDRLLPTPRVSSEEPPAFRHHDPVAPAAESVSSAARADEPVSADEPASADEPVSARDDLTIIKGIGPVRAGHFAEAGITTFSALAAADPGAIAEELDVSEDAAAAWVADAASRAG